MLNNNSRPPKARSVIDRKSHVPFYVQLEEILRTEIERGQLKPGERLPGEFELCQRYDVSRTVVRQALRDLTDEGLIVRDKGKGTFVAEPKISESLVQKLTGFYQDMVDRGFTPITQVLKQEVVPASEKVAGYLGLKPDTSVIEIQRLRFIQDEPIVLVTSFLPYALCPQLAHADLTKRSLYAFLEKEAGLFIARGRRTIEAVPASESEARLLLVERGAPLIKLDSVSYLSDDTPMEYYRALHRGDRSRFEVELVRTWEQIGVREGPAELPRSNDIVQS
ncbi:MAG TPA: GntR family transcriptional regulator [Anaerolineae bacterium]